MKIKPVKDIKIRTKLILLGTVCVLGLVVLGRESVSTALTIKQAGDETSDIWMNAVIVAEELNTTTSDYRIKESRHAVTTDSRLMEDLEQEMGQIREEIEKKFEEYGKLPTWESDQKIIQEAQKAWDEYLEYSQELIETSKGNDREKATAMMMGRSQELFGQASGLFLDAVAHDKRAVEVQKHQTELLYQRMIFIKFWVIGIVTLIMAGLIWYLIRAIEGPAEALLEAARKVTNGNLDVRLPHRSRDELGTLEDAMNQMIQRLEDIVKDEIRLFRETGSENFQARSKCEQAYRGDFAPILYGFTSLQSRLKEIKQRQEESGTRLEEELGRLQEQIREKEKAQRRQEEPESGKAEKEKARQKREQKQKKESVQQKEAKQQKTSKQQLKESKQQQKEGAQQ